MSLASQLSVGNGNFNFSCQFCRDTGNVDKSTKVFGHTDPSLTSGKVLEWIHGICPDCMEDCWNNPTDEKLKCLTTCNLCKKAAVLQEIDIDSTTSKIIKMKTLMQVSQKLQTLQKMQKKGANIGLITGGILSGVGLITAAALHKSNQILEREIVTGVLCGATFSLVLMLAEDREILREIAAVIGRTIRGPLSLELTVLLVGTVVSVAIAGAVRIGVEEIEFTELLEVSETAARVAKSALEVIAVTVGAIEGFSLGLLGGILGQSTGSFIGRKWA